MKNMEFRAWDGEQFLYLDLNNVESDINIEWLLMFFRLPKQQYIGLTDKNGVKLFGEDYVNSTRFNSNVLAKIVFYKGAYCLQTSFDNGKPYPISECAELTKIGNEFENPELLEQL